MNHVFPLGKDAKLYLGEAGAELAAMDPIADARDVTVTLEAAVADVTTRGNRGWRATVPTLRECTVEFEMSAVDGSTAAKTLRQAYLAGTLLELAALDRDVATPGSNGPKGTFGITGFNRGEPLEEGIAISVTAKMAVFDKWVDIVAGTVAATGTVTLTDQPDDANLVVIGDGARTVTFEFDTAVDPGQVEPGHTRVKVGVDAAATIAALILAVNLSALAIGAAEGAGDSADLTHKTPGPAGNVPITKTGANIAVTGMSGGE